MRQLINKDKGVGIFVDGSSTYELILHFFDSCIYPATHPLFCRITDGDLSRHRMEMVSQSRHLLNLGIVFQRTSSPDAGYCVSEGDAT